MYNQPFQSVEKVTIREEVGASDGRQFVQVSSATMLTVAALGSEVTCRRGQITWHKAVSGDAMCTTRCVASLHQLRRRRNLTSHRSWLFGYHVAQYAAAPFVCPETTPFIAQSTTWVPSGSATATGDGFVGTAGSTATAIKSRTEHLDLTQEWSYYAPDMTVFYEGNPLFGVFSVRSELTTL